HAIPTSQPPHHHRNPPDDVDTLLPPRRERPRHSRAAEQRDERAPFHLRTHSITSSARSRNDSGIVRPSALAVVRLMTNSHFVGCSTGRSAGFAPLRILSTYSAARRNRSGRFGPYDIRFPAATYSLFAYTAGSRATKVRVLMRTWLACSSGSLE